MRPFARNKQTTRTRARNPSKKHEARNEASGKKGRGILGARIDQAWVERETGGPLLTGFGGSIELLVAVNRALVRAI